jgi:hypothetical protein
MLRHTWVFYNSIINRRSLWAHAVVGEPTDAHKILRNAHRLIHFPFRRHLGRRRLPSNQMAESTGNGPTA